VGHVELVKRSCKPPQFTYLCNNNGNASQRTTEVGFSWKLSLPYRLKQQTAL